jgi:hypothetical protein
MSTQELIDKALESAVALAWDGCHKIYILMDDEQANLTRSYGYGNSDGDSEFQWIEHEPDGRARAAATLRDWWDYSCGLRFISTVTSPGQNEDFVHIIPQCEEWVS